MSLYEEVTTHEIEKLYRAIADREPTLELMTLVYDLFGDRYGLRPPVSELRLADSCKAKVRAHG